MECSFKQKVLRESVCVLRQGLGCLMKGIS